MASSTLKMDKIDVRLAEAKTSLPETVTARLSGSPTKSPDELARAEVRSASLRQLHLENIKERANVASSRAHEANLRRLRLASAQSERILKKALFAESKVDAKKEAAEAERLLKKEKREEAQRHVREMRAMAEKARSARFAELALAETIAHQKWSKAIAETKSKSHAQVQHALAVAAAHKEKAVLEAAAIGEKLELKLAAAETRRELAAAASPSAPALSIAAGDAAALAASTGPPSPPKGAKATLHRVLNDTKVNAQTKAKLLEASMAKAVEKRAAHLATVQAKAEAVCAKAAAVVAKSKAVTDGTDKETADAKAALYDKLVRAESARLFALRAKYGALHAPAPAAASLLVVDLSEVIKPRKPPAALSLRLSSCGRGLLATAKSRQAGAAARRLGAKYTKHAKLAAAAERRAAAAAKYCRARASKAAAVDAKAERALINKALADGARKFAIVTQRAKASAAALKRDAADAATKARGAAKRATCASATEKKGAKLRGIAKAGVLPVRQAANTSRKAALVDVKRARAAAFEARATAAAGKRTELLASRVAIAKKRMVAPHPKREMADTEVKALFSDA